MTNDKPAAAGNESHHPRLQALLDLQPDAVIFLDGDGCVTTWNNGAASIFGWSADEIRGQSLWKKSFQDDTATRSLAELAARSQKMGGWLQERARRKDGDAFTAACRVSVCSDRAETAYIMLVRDLTDELLAEQQLVQAQKLEALGHLTGGLAHDFNNILGIILGSLEVVVESVGSSEERELVEASLNAARRGTEITRSLLAVARRRPIRPQLTNINTLLEEMVPLLRQAAGKQAEVDISAETCDATCLMDSGALNNALINLVVNARDALPAHGGRIIVYAYRTDILPRSLAAPLELKAGSYVVIGVDDNGAGMAPEVALRAFDPFFTTKERTQGTGLGLAMVYGFARQSGGTARIQSAPGTGTSVQIILPVAANGNS